MDSGASHHMSPCVSDFCELTVSVVEDVKLANGTVVQVVGQGSVMVQGIYGPVRVSNVLFVPQLSLS